MEPRKDTDRNGKVGLGVGELGIVGECFPADGKTGLRMNQEEEYTARDGEDAEMRGAMGESDAGGWTQLVGVDLGARGKTLSGAWWVGYPPNHALLTGYRATTFVQPTTLC